jgi:hypothetical protein
MRLEISVSKPSDRNHARLHTHAHLHRHTYPLIKTQWNILRTGLRSQKFMQYVHNPELNLK